MRNHRSDEVDWTRETSCMASAFAWSQSVWHFVAGDWVWWCQTYSARIVHDGDRRFRLEAVTSGCRRGASSQYAKFSRPPCAENRIHRNIWKCFSTEVCMKPIIFRVVGTNFIDRIQGDNKAATYSYMESNCWKYILLNYLFCLSCLFRCLISLKENLLLNNILLLNVS